MNADYIDQPADIREALDLAKLESYLLAHIQDAQGPLIVKQFPGGFSNLTYALTLGERQLVLRRPPFGAEIKSGHDMQREYRVLSGLDGTYPKAPTPVLYCADEVVIGAPFYVMERLSGVILRGQPPKGLDLPPDLMRRLSQATIEGLADLHAVDVGAAGLSDLGQPQGYVQRQIEGWIRRYGRAQTEEVPHIEGIMAWLTDHMPPDSGAALIHNDYKYDNLVLNPADLTDIIAVLDWEMCTLGDPLMDLGTTLGYWIEAKDPAELQTMFGLTARPGNLTRAQIVEHYQTVTGREVSHPLYYYVYGLFKIAVIVQQIAARYQQGLTDDPRFAFLPVIVKASATAAANAIDRDSL